MTRLARRTARIATSPTMKVTATVDRLRREGVEVIDFGAGEPDFATPDAINAAAHAAIDQHFTKYTPVGGTAELKRAICERYRADYGVEYAREPRSSRAPAASRRCSTPRWRCSAPATRSSCTRRTGRRSPSR